MRPTIHDNDVSTITVKVGDKGVASWSYDNDEERRMKMRKAHSWCDGFISADMLLSRMSTEHKDGGPAFPLSTTDETVDYHGMSLRDWFAGQFICSAYKTNLCASELAEEAYEYADAMLKARQS